MHKRRHSVPHMTQAARPPCGRTVRRLREVFMMCKRAPHTSIGILQSRHTRINWSERRWTLRMSAVSIQTVPRGGNVVESSARVQSAAEPLQRNGLANWWCSRAELSNRVKGGIREYWTLEWGLKLALH